MPQQLERPNRNRWILTAYGIWFVGGNYGIGTAIWPSTITDPGEMHMMHLFGFIPIMINGWHLYFHLVTGLVCLGLAAARGPALPTGLLGGAYVLTGGVGLLVSGTVYGLIMVDTFGNWVHVAEGIGLLATAFTTGCAQQVATRSDD